MRHDGGDLVLFEREWNRIIARSHRTREGASSPRCPLASVARPRQRGPTQQPPRQFRAGMRR